MAFAPPVGLFRQLCNWIYNFLSDRMCSSIEESNRFGVQVGLHQGSALSPCLFLLLMDVLIQDVRKDVLGSMMFADDIVLCGDDETDMTEYMTEG